MTAIGRRSWTDWSIVGGPRLRVRDALNYIGIVSDGCVGGKWSWLVLGSRARNLWCINTTAGLAETMELAMARADREMRRLTAQNRPSLCKARRRARRKEDRRLSREWLEAAHKRLDAAGIGARVAARV